MKRPAQLLAISLLLFLASSGICGAQPLNTEPNTDRMGNDYRRTEGVRTPDECRIQCENDAKCQAYTWVKPGLQGPTAVCYLKDPAPGPAPSSCCVSGARLSNSPPATNGNATGYWQRVGTAGTKAYTTPAGRDWVYKEDFSAPGGATCSSSLKGELIHKAAFTWTAIPEKVFPGQVFPLTVSGKVDFHKPPWFTNDSVTVQFYGALYPMYWTVGDQVQKKITLDAKVPVGNPDKTKDNHFLHLRFSCNSAGNSNPFRYVYEWIPPNP